MKPMWVIKQQATQQGTSLEIYLYDDIAADGEDWWTGETIESNTSANHIQQVLQDAGQVDKVNIYINSYGGEVAEGVAIYNQLKRNPAQKTVYIDGFACSIASVIAMVGDKVIMGLNTLMMIHNASWGAWGTSKDLRKAADDLDVINLQAIKSYQAKAGDKLPDDVLQSLLDNETWLTAEQCVQYGLADEIAGQTENETLLAAKQRLKQAQQSEMAALLDKNKPAAKVPQNNQATKTNAERLMMAFKKKMEVK